MQFKKGFGVELLRIESVRLLPDFPQLSNAALRDGEINKEEKHVRELHSLPLVSNKNQHRCVPEH